MKRYIILALLALMTINVVLASEIIPKADSAYTKGDYNTALSLYSKAVTTAGSSAELYYNLGNAYYRNGNIPQAIIYYERALRIDPSFSRARENLDFVNDRIIDKSGEYGSFFSRTATSVALSRTSDTWAYWALGLFIVFIAALVLYFFADRIIIRKIGFFGGIILILCSVFCIIEALYARSLALRTDEAIITAKSVILSTSPRAPLSRNEEAMLLHEGTKLYIQDSIKVKNDTTSTIWYDVMVDNDHRAWIDAASIEKI